MKKAVFFDIDGTLWDDKLVIPDSTREAIRLLQENGHYAFICTGRTKAFVRDPRLLGLGFDGMIAGCGTYIEYKGEELYYTRIDRQKIKETLPVLRKYKMRPILEGKVYLYLDDADFAEDPYGKNLIRDMGEFRKQIVGNEDNWEVSKFSVSGIDGIYQQALEELKGQYDFLVHGPWAIEFIPVGFSKASGIQKTCELLGIRQEDTYAFGDSVNDLEMLRYVAHGIAMGNGTDEAKAAADYVTAGIKEDGIFKGLQHYGLI